MKILIVLTLFILSPAYAGTIVKCINDLDEISYADEVCSYGTRELSKTVLQSYKTSEWISKKNLKKAKPYPEQSISKQNKALIQSRIIQVMSSLTMIKVKMAEYYMTNAKWPTEFQQIKLSQKSLTSSLIDKTQLDKNGRMKVKLNRVLGTKKQLWLYPQAVMGNSQIEWQCYTNFPASWLRFEGQQLCLSRDI
ncbi:MAG: pilin [Gammaproteobacteria bacterium]|nr:pilin [Gammaproteobacteria bacterium]